MSREALTWARQQRAGSTATKAVLLLLADYADRTGVAWPSTRTLAGDAECDQRTVRRHVERLQTAGLAEVITGTGRGPNRYVLPIRSEAPSRLTTDPSSEASERLTTRSDIAAPECLTDENRSEALDLRSAALDLRSEAPRVSDQQQREQNVRTELTTEQAANAAPRAQARGRVREHATPAELNATAAGARAYLLVADWTKRNPGIVNGHRRALTRRVDELLAQGADVAHMSRALDLAHQPPYRNAVASLAYAYEDARREATAPTAPAHTRPSTTSNRVAAALAHLDPEED